MFIVVLAEMAIVFCDRAEKAQGILNDSDKTPSLKYIVVFEPLSNNNMETAEKHGIQLLSLAQLEDEGRQNLKDPIV